MNPILGAFCGPITGRKFFAWMVMFFGVIAAVNALFIFLALDTWPGLTTGRAYEKGLAYNKVLEEAAEQNARGWKSRVHLGGTTPRGRVLSVNITGPNGPITGLKVIGVLTRPVGESTRIPVTLLPDGVGRYTALVRMPALGRWHLELTTSRGPRTTYRMIHELALSGDAK